MASLITAQGTVAITDVGPPASTAIPLFGGTQLLLINDGPDSIQYEITDSGEATKAFVASDFSLKTGEAEVMDLRTANSLFAITDSGLTASVRYKCIDAGRRGAK